MKTGLKRNSVLFYITSCLLIILSFSFRFTRGFLSHSETLIYINEAGGDGSYENIVVFFGVFIFSVPLILKMVRYNRRVSRSDYALLFTALLLQILAYLLTLSHGAYFSTIIRGRNIVLTLLTITYTVTFFWSLYCILKK